MIWVKCLIFKVFHNFSQKFQIMHPHKNIEKLSELKDFFTSSEKVSDTFIDMLKAFSCGSVSRMLNTIKKRGYVAGELLSVLLMLPFAGVSSVRALFFSGLVQLSQAQKDAYYRLKNMETINWRKLLWLVAKRFRQLTEEKGKSEGTRCLILDDSLLLKTSRFTEGISKVFDHVTKRYLWGFKLLLLGWWDGKSFLTLDFSLHREKGRNKKKPFGMSKRQKNEQFNKKREKNTPGAKRKRELDTSKIKQAIRMLCRAVKYGFVADYVLTDSWFFCFELLQCVRNLKKGAVHLIAMARMGIAKYEYEGKLYSPAELKQCLKGNKKRCRKLKAHYIECLVCYQGMPVKLFFVRYSGQAKWKLMVTTDSSLSFIRMMEIYSIRWSIEVFFKEAKQHLLLGKSQSRDLDAQITDATIAMIRYMLLGLCKRFSDYETFGQLFEAHSKQLLELTMAERIWGLMLELAREICEVLEISPEQLLRKLLGNNNKQTRLEKLLYLWLNAEKDDEIKKAA